jgi:hypothetical protein
MTTVLLTGFEPSENRESVGEGRIKHERGTVG